MIIGEAIHRIKHTYNRGVELSDSRLSNRYIYSKLRTVRMRLVSQELKKEQVVNEWTYQTLPCIEFAEALSHECLCISDGCKVMKSKNPIPAIFTDNDHHIIKSVTSIDGSKLFTITSFADTKNISGNKYTGNSLYYYIHNGYLFLVNTKIDVATMVATFEDPLEAEVFSGKCSTGINCKSYLDYDLHIDGKLNEAMLMMAADEVLYAYSQMREDKVQNASDDTNSVLRHPSSYRYDTGIRE